jgi:hypothetical protein
MHVRTVKFKVGELVVTPTAAAAIAESGATLDALMQRHQSGDWGEISAAIRAVNERGLSDQFNLQSGYALPDGRKVVIVTNRDRSATMVHLDAR